MQVKGENEKIISDCRLKVWKIEKEVKYDKIVIVE